MPTDNRIQDGAIFVFAHGTNPELLLLVEALGDSREKSQWHFSACRSSHAELHLLLDQQEVWTNPRASGSVFGPNAAYWHFQTSVIRSSE